MDTINIVKINIKTNYKYIFDEFKDNNILDTHVDVFILAVTIGIKEDKFNSEMSGDDKTIPGDVMSKANNRKQLENLFYIAALTSSEAKRLYEDEEERINWAFSAEKDDDNRKIKFLSCFAEYGLKVIDEKFRGTSRITPERKHSIILKMRKYCIDNYKKVEKYLNEGVANSGVDVDVHSND